MPQRRRIRLPREAYSEIGAICSVTIGVRNREPLFADHQAASMAVTVLRDHATRRGVSLYAFCIMPDHVHLVLGPSPDCDIIAFVAEFKNLAQRAVWQLGNSGPIWQASFWDRFLRKDEQLEPLLHYVMNNPVRAGLVADPAEYPFCAVTGLAR